MVPAAKGMMDMLETTNLKAKNASRYGQLKASLRASQPPKQRLVNANVVVAESRAPRRRRLATAREAGATAERQQGGDPRGRRIIVAVDETEDTERALRWTVNNFYRDGDTLHLLHVVPFVPGHAAPGTVYYTPPPSGDVQEKMVKRAEHFIDQRLLPITNELGINCEVDVVEEESTETIAEAVCHSAAEIGAAAIVVASHKKSALATLLTGSSSREVAGKAAVPVLVFHG